MQKERSEKVLENLDSLEKRQKIRKFLVISIISVLLVIIIFIGLAFYQYFQSPEKTLGLGAEIESVLLSADGKMAYIKLLGGSLDKNITKIKFLFYGSDGNEHVYETSEGIKEIEVPYSRSFWDWLFGRQLVGSYDYQINSDEIGLENFNDIENVSSKFEFQTETGQEVETPVLDTQKPTPPRNQTTGGGGGDGGGNPPPTCIESWSCSSWSNCVAGTKTRTCTDINNCGTQISKPAEQQSCVEIINCTSDLNCTGSNGVCGVGKCNLTSGGCYVNYSIGNVCKNNISDCDAVEYCSGSSSVCPADANKSDGSVCISGSCQGGKCVSICTENWQCGSWGNCVASQQTRTCTDINNCGTQISKPAEQQSCVVATGNWVPPIGIPRPEFGIEETYRMYDNVSNRNPALNYTQNAEGGFYTHYIDNSVACSDTNNNGTENNPRCTIPYIGLGSHTYLVLLKPGDIMEVHGIHNLKEIRPGGWLDGYEFTGGGTNENPAFVRGDSDNPAVITTTQADSYGNVLTGSYIILENFEFNNSLVVVRASNSAIRNCEVYNIERVNGRAVSISGAKDFVFYNNNVHHNWGTWPDGSHDMHNIAVTGFSERIWIVDNELHHASYNINGTIAKTGGDAIQVMGDYCETMVDPSIWPNKIFIGRNDMHHNTENSVDIKCSHNVVISQNEAYEDGFTPYSSASMINHEHANNTWFIFNKVHDVRVGIRPEDAIGEAFVIGNVIYNIKYPVSSGTIYGNFVGGVWARIVPTHIIGNTFYNVTGGALIPSDSGNCTIVNNLISLVSVPYPGNLSWYHAGVEVGGSADEHTIIDYNLFYQPPGVEEYTPDGVIKLRWGSAVYEGLKNFTKTGRCLNCIEADPLFANEEDYNFSLKQGSPAIDSGTDEGIVQEIMQKYFDTFGVSINVDFEGNPRPQGAKWDIGAYEYSTSTQEDVYYVSQLDVNCNDSYNLTQNDEQHPWCNLSKTCASDGSYIFYIPIRDIPEGSLVIIKKGNYGTFGEDARSNCYSDSKTERNKWTIYKANAGDKVVFNGISLSGHTPHQGSHNLIFDGININGSVYFEYTDNVQIKNCNIKTKPANYTGLETGIYKPYFYPNSHAIQGRSSNNILIENNSISETYRGIGGTGNNWAIRGNHLFNLAEDGINAVPNNFLIENNLIHDSHSVQTTIDMHGIKSGDFSEGEEVIQQGTNARGIAYKWQTAGGGYLPVWQTTSVSFKTQAEGGGIITGQQSGASVSNIILVDPSHIDAIHIESSIIKDIIIRNNTAYGFSNQGISLYGLGGMQNVTLSNNLVYNCGKGFVVSGVNGVDFYNNTAYNAYVRLENTADHPLTSVINNMYNNIFEELVHNGDIGGAYIRVINHGNNIFENNPNGAGGIYKFYINPLNELVNINVTNVFVNATNNDYRPLINKAACNGSINPVGVAVGVLPCVCTNDQQCADLGLGDCNEISGKCSGLLSISPFTRILSLIKNILTGKTENVMNETNEDNEVKFQYIILSLLAVIILIIAIIIVKKKGKKFKRRKRR